MMCNKCKTQMRLMRGTFKEDSIDYEFYKCPKCGEEILDMEQLEKTAKKYRKLRESKKITFSKWGNSIAIRIPSDFTSELGIKSGTKGTLYKDKDGLRIAV